MRRFCASFFVILLYFSSALAHSEHHHGNDHDKSLELLEILERTTRELEYRPNERLKPYMRLRSGERLQLDTPLRKMIESSLSELKTCTANGTCAVDHADEMSRGRIRRIGDKFKAWQEDWFKDGNARLRIESGLWKGWEWKSRYGLTIASIWLAIEVVEHHFLGPTPALCKFIGGAMTGFSRRFEYARSALGRGQMTCDELPARLKQSFTNFVMIGRYRAALKTVWTESPATSIQRSALGSQSQNPVGDTPFWYAAFMQDKLDLPADWSLSEESAEKVNPLYTSLDAALDHTLDSRVRFLHAEDLRSFFEFHRELLESTSSIAWSFDRGAFRDLQRALIHLAVAEDRLDYLIKSLALSEKLSASEADRVRPKLRLAIDKTLSLTSTMLAQIRTLQKPQAELTVKTLNLALASRRLRDEIRSGEIASLPVARSDKARCWFALELKQRHNALTKH